MKQYPKRFRMLDAGASVRSGGHDLVRARMVYGPIIEIIRENNLCLKPLPQTNEEIDVDNCVIWTDELTPAGVELLGMPLHRYILSWDRINEYSEKRLSAFKAELEKIKKRLS